MEHRNYFNIDYFIYYNINVTHNTVHISTVLFYLSSTLPAVYVDCFITMQSFLQLQMRLKRMQVQKQVKGANRKKRDNSYLLNNT